MGCLIKGEKVDIYIIYFQLLTFISLIFVSLNWEAIENNIHLIKFNGFLQFPAFFINTFYYTLMVLGDHSYIDIKK